MRDGRLISKHEVEQTLLKKNIKNIELIDVIYERKTNYL